MEIGFRTVGFGEQKIEKILAQLAEIGFDGVELCLENPDLDPFQLTPSRIRAIQRQLESLNLKLASISYHGAADQLEVRRRKTYRALEITAQFGAKTLIIGSRREEPARLRAQWMEHLDWYEELCRKALPHGFRIAVEPEPGLVIRNAEDMVRMLQEVNASNLAVNLDMAHAWVMADDLSWAVYTLAPHLAQVHLADVKDGEHAHLPPGEGELNFQEIREVLASVEYRGPVVIDLPDIQADPVGYATRSLNHLRTVWNLAE